MHTLHQDLDRILISEDELHQRVHEMGQQIAQDYAGENIVVVSVLRGAAVFMADLVREIDLPLEMDYMAASSYGNSAKSSGVVTFHKDISTDIEGRHVIIAEDVLDSGLTLQATIDHLAARNPKSIQVATLLHKKVPNQLAIDCRYTGFMVPNEFIVGYGLDYAERYRNLPYIGVLKEEVYSSKAD